MTHKHVAALRRLVEAIEELRESGETSEGYDPDEVDFEAVDSGPDGYVKQAVCDVQPFYGGKLPALDARKHWSELTTACRHERDGRKARRMANRLIEWGQTEITRLETEDLVTLKQAAAMVSRSSRTLERLKRKRGFPRPKVLGGGGKPHEYAWGEMRPFLEQEYKRSLPEQFPFLRFRPV